MILKEHIASATSDEILIVGGDYNVHIGRNEDQPRVCGVFGMGVTNNQGKDLLNFCEENSLCFVNSFYKEKRKGTWLSVPLQRWYELDGFLMKQSQRHKIVRKVGTISEASISDHKPKKIKIEMKRKEERRRRPRPKKRPRILWEKLRNDEKARDYQDKIAEILEEEGEIEITVDDPTSKWDKIASTVTRAAEEVCGLEEKHVQNEWMVGRDEEILVMTNNINTAIRNRNDLLVRHRLEVENRDQINLQIEQTRQELKEARKTLKRTTKQWETEWWNNVIEECKQAGETNNSSRMYKSLKKLGTRGITKARESTKITKEEFREHFK